jgi:hypothetical protein
VQGAAFTLVVAGALAVNFRHDQLRIGPLGDQVAVAAVVADDNVFLFEGALHTGRHRLLTGAMVLYRSSFS